MTRCRGRVLLNRLLAVGHDGYFRHVWAQIVFERLGCRDELEIKHRFGPNTRLPPSQKEAFQNHVSQHHRSGSIRAVKRNILAFVPCIPRQIDNSDRQVALLDGVRLRTIPLPFFNHQKLSKLPFNYRLWQVFLNT